MSIYIHIPFCNTICTYCDFCKIYYNKKYIDKYLDSLEREIKKRYKGEVVKTIYIGGGTPTSLDEYELEKLFKIINIFNRENDIEFTIEGNVESITEDKLKNERTQEEKYPAQRRHLDTSWYQYPYAIANLWCRVERRG